MLKSKYKELKESMRIMFHQIYNSNKGTEILKRNQREILAWKIQLLR